MTGIIPTRLARLHRDMGYLPGLVSGGFLFVAGQLGRDDDLRVIEEPRAQFRRAFENVITVLDEAGCTLADIVDVTTFHVRMSETMPVFREIRREVMGMLAPPWTAIGIAELSRPGLLVEIKCIARMPRG